MRVRKASKYLTTLSKSLEKKELVPICSIIIGVSPLLHRIHHLSVYCPKNRVDDEEEKQLSADELVFFNFCFICYLQMSLYNDPFHLKRSLVKPPAVEEATSL